MMLYIVEKKYRCSEHKNYKQQSINTRNSIVHILWRHELQNLD
ncbi:hypothetical protein PN497_03100 [Sphaerospermopsis kisseleviana CS-549]|uniref:Transposase n=1 Tax=Sphaerospermopsis kisseleviana CS-549 TaxID=3021783 RepID=A0ABT4ZLV6_9CYAN|nr:MULTISPECIES: hypothetical protein [Sphaerospermopsis]MDB9440368.1 hypothetical protein [Sphaerospermopsis kisseleviana CS-549]